MRTQQPEGTLSIEWGIDPSPSQTTRASYVNLSEFSHELVRLSGTQS